MEKKYGIPLMIIATILLVVGGLAIYTEYIRKDILIIVDPGHGGSDPGTTSITGVHEKDINLEIARILENELRMNGYKVELIRTEDETIGVYERAEIANRSHASFYVSLHCNAIENNPHMEGVQILYYPEGTGRNEILARLMMDSIVESTGAEDMRLEARKDLIVLSHTKMKSLMVEMGFLTNNIEALNLENGVYQREIARGIRKAIDKYYREGLID